MEPNHQLFGHFLRYRAEMQQETAKRHEANTLVLINVNGLLRATMRKLLDRVMSFDRRFAKHSSDYPKKEDFQTYRIIRKEKDEAQ
jgi:hypothetical protein